jgi:hypothetical protein
MKRLALSLVLICVVALPAVGATNLNSSRSNIYKIVQDAPGGPLNCRVSVKGVKGDKACTPAQVEAIAASVPRSAPRLSLAKDGTTLLCGTAPCTTAHLPALKEAAVTADGTRSNTY